jgi:hypothetical protein
VFLVFLEDLECLEHLVLQKDQDDPEHLVFPENRSMVLEHLATLEILEDPEFLECLGNY